MYLVKYLDEDDGNIVRVVNLDNVCEMEWDAEFIDTEGKRRADTLTLYFIGSSSQDDVRHLRTRPPIVLLGRQAAHVWKIVQSESFGSEMFRRFDPEAPSGDTP